MNDHRNVEIANRQGTVYDLVWFDDVSAWHLRAKDLVGELYSVEGWDSKHHAMLAFQQGNVAFQAKPPGAA